MLSLFHKIETDRGKKFLGLCRECGYSLCKNQCTKLYNRSGADNVIFGELFNSCIMCDDDFLIHSRTKKNLISTVKKDLKVVNYDCVWTIVKILSQ